MIATTTGRRRSALAATLAVAAMVFTACGEDEPAGGGGASGGGGESGAQLVSECQQTIDKAKQPIEFKAPGPPIDVSSLRGKRITLVSLAQAIPAVADQANQTRDAAQELGITVDIFDAKGDIRRMQQGLAQGVSQKSDAIILIGVPTNVNEAALEDAEAAKIPVISSLNNEPEANEPGQGGGENIYASSAPSYYEVGQWLACKAVVDTKGKANVVIFGAKELKPSAKEVEGMRSILEKCDGCTVDENTTPTAEWQTRLPSLAQSEIRKNPNANYFLPLYDGMGIFVTSGVRQAGAEDKVKVASFNAAPAALELVKKGPIFTADPGQVPGWMALGALDQAMRGMLGEEPGDPKVPSRFFDKENLQGVDVKNQDALFGTDHESGFRELWGVQG